MRIGRCIVKCYRHNHYPDSDCCSSDAEFIRCFEESCTIEAYLLHSVIVYKIYRHAQSAPTPEKSYIPSRHVFTDLLDALWNAGMHD